MHTADVLHVFAAGGIQEKGRSKKIIFEVSAECCNLVRGG